MIRGGAALYFDDKLVSDTNMAARVIPLGSGCRVERLPLEGLTFSGPSSTFVLVTPAREYIFGCATNEEADLWVKSFTDEIEASSTPDAKENSKSESST